jgi:hypothetical protein
MLKLYFRHFASQNSLFCLSAAAAAYSLKSGGTDNARVGRVCGYLRLRGGPKKIDVKLVLRRKKALLIFTPFLENNPTTIG